VRPNPPFWVRYAFTGRLPARYTGIGKPAGWQILGKARFDEPTSALLAEQVASFYGAVLFDGLPMCANTRRWRSSSRCATCPV
jgi:hypothetical protein